MLPKLSALLILVFELDMVIIWPVVETVVVLFDGRCGDGDEWEWWCVGQPFSNVGADTANASCKLCVGNGGDVIRFIRL